MGTTRNLSWNHNLTEGFSKELPVLPRKESAFQFRFLFLKRETSTETSMDCNLRFWRFFFHIKMSHPNAGRTGNTRIDSRFWSVRSEHFQRTAFLQFALLTGVRKRGLKCASENNGWLLSANPSASLWGSFFLRCRQGITRADYCRYCCITLKHCTSGKDLMIPKSCPKQVQI